MPPPGDTQPNKTTEPDFNMLIDHVLRFGADLGQISENAVRLDEKVNAIQTALDRGTTKFDKIDEQFKGLEKDEIKPLRDKVTKLMVIYGLIIAGLTTGIGVLAVKLFSGGG